MEVHSREKGRAHWTRTALRRTAKVGVIKRRSVVEEIYRKIQAADLWNTFYFNIAVKFIPIK